jgi:CBS domain-containing protein
MIVGQVMTREPITVTPDTTIAEGAQLMLDHHISGLPVIGADHMVVGIVTEGDLLRRAETGTERHRSRWLELLLGPGRLAHDYVDAHARKVGEVMTTDLVFVSPQDPLEHVVELMEKRRIKRVPVIANGRLAGIVSRADLVRALLSGLTQKEASAKEPATDAEIRKAIVAIIDKEPWGPRFSVDVTIKDGIAHLRGTVTDDRERTALTVAAENVPGVKAVRDHLVWVEPNSGLVIPAQGEEA